MSDPCTKSEIINDIKEDVREIKSDVKELLSFKTKVVFGLTMLSGVLSAVWAAVIKFF